MESTDDAYVGGDVTDLAPRVDGLIAQVAVIDNQYVHAGQLLVKIDDRDYRVALAKAQAEVAGDMATLRNLDANRVLELALIDEAKAAVSSALAANALAQANQSRYRVLANEQAGSVQASQTADAGSAEADAKMAESESSARRRAIPVGRDRDANAADASRFAKCSGGCAGCETQYRLYRNPRAGGRRGRQSQCPSRRLCDHRRAAGLNRAHPAGFGSTPISRKTSWRIW